nr:MAG TPA: KilAC domain protein [Caudoviricetes sp.]
MNTKELQVLDRRNLFGKDFKIYGTMENPLFLAKDVAVWIDYDVSSTNRLIADVDDDEKLLGRLFRAGQKRDAWFLTEDGLYEVLMQSRKPIAKQFKKEVKNILKQIRKTGGYIPVNEKDDDLTILAKAHLILERTIQEKNAIIEEKSNALAIAQPKADLYDKLMNADGYFSFNVAAKELGVGRNALMRRLRDKGILFRDGLSNIAYQKYCNRGYFVVKHSIGRNGFACGVTKVTPKGLEYIHKVILSDHNGEAMA